MRNTPIIVHAKKKLLLSGIFSVYVCVCVCVCEATASHCVDLFSQFPRPVFCSASAVLKALPRRVALGALQGREGKKGKKGKKRKKKEKKKKQCQLQLDGTERNHFSDSTIL